MIYQNAHNDVTNQIHNTMRISCTKNFACIALVEFELKQIIVYFLSLRVCFFNISLKFEGLIVLF